MHILFILCFLIGNIFPTSKEENLSAKKIMLEAFDKLNNSDKESCEKFHKSPAKTFKSALENFITKHVHAIYSAEMDGLGTATIYSMQTTGACITQKITKELEFLASHGNEFDTALIQLWLGDAEQDFWPFLKMITDKKEIWPEIKKLAQEKIKLRLPDKKNIPPLINWSDNFQLPFSKKATTTKPSKEFSFTIDEVSLFLALEDSVFAEFSKIMEHFKNMPLSLKAIIEGHIAWLEFRASLLAFYIHLGVTPDIIKIRMTCLHLSQLYFYKHFFAYFTKQNHEKRCLSLAPREYNDIYDCSIVRKPKNLPSELPCFPK